MTATATLGFLLWSIATYVSAKWPRIVTALIATVTMFGTFNFFSFFGYDQILGLEPGISKILFYISLPGFILALTVRNPIKVCGHQKNAGLILTAFALSFFPSIFFAYDNYVASKVWLGLIRWLIFWSLAIVFLEIRDAKRILKLWFGIVVVINFLYILYLTGIGDEFFGGTQIIGFDHQGRFKIIGQNPNSWAYFNF